MNYYEKVAKTIGLCLLITALVGFVVVCLTLATDVFLLIFLAILFAVFLTHTSRWSMKYVPLSYSWNLAILVILLFVATLGSGVYFGAAIEEKLQATSEHLDSSVRELQRWLQKRPYTRQALSRVPFAGQILDIDLSTAEDKAKSGASQSNQADDEDAANPPGDSSSQGETETHDEESQKDQSSNSKKESKDSAAKSQADSQGDESKSKKMDVSIRDLVQGSSAISGKVFPTLGKIFSTTFGMLTSIAVVFFVGLFLAVNPDLYQQGVVKLFPRNAQAKTSHVMQEIATVLYSWLGGRLLTMLITGFGTGVGLWFLGVPMAGTVGGITALLTFVPNIGAVLALLLAMLLALSQGPATVVWVVVLYCILQLVESNILTPLIQQQKTSIPPALLISFQLLIGVLTGFLGLMVATPLLAASMVIVREVWVDEVIDHS